MFPHVVSRHNTCLLPINPRISLAKHKTQKRKKKKKNRKKKEKEGKREEKKEKRKIPLTTPIGKKKQNGLASCRRTVDEGIGLDTSQSPLSHHTANTSLTADSKVDFPQPEAHNRREREKKEKRKKKERKKESLQKGGMK